MKDLKNMTLPQLVDFVRDQGLPLYRATQIFSWLYRSGIHSFDQMTNIKKDLRARFSSLASFSRLQPAVIEQSRDGTVKYGFLLDDCAVVETVFIPEPDHSTLCVSSQVGCAMGCKFCLTGTMGFTRNLRAAEIVNQVAAVIEHQLSMTTPDGKEKNAQQVVNNLVFMGMGEPLLNFENLVTALSILTEQSGLDFSDRKITVSTCGIVPRMKELGEQTAVNLAVSLHSADNEMRSRLMPINRTYPLEMLLQACQEFPMPKRRRIMFEYILLKDVNDSPEHAKLLAVKLKNIRCKINLLPYNRNDALPFQTPAPEKVQEFQQILWDAGYTVLLRNSRGADISAACGQLAVIKRKE
jgi:23S rRNA (adenine2503-C2)-methyltransferase